MTLTIIPLRDETRLRNIHSILGTPINFYKAGSIVMGDEVWIAKADVADNSKTKAGDKWLLVKSINGKSATGWMSIIQNGVEICKVVQTTITPLKNETRLRDIHSTLGAVINSYNAGTILLGEDIWTAEADAQDGSNTKAGDMWLLIKSINGVPASGWMAIIHNGIPICRVIETFIPPVDTSMLPSDVVKVLYSDVFCVMGDGSHKTFRLTPQP